MTKDEIIRLAAAVSKRIQDVGCWQADFLRIVILEEVIRHYPFPADGASRELSDALRRELRETAEAWVDSPAISRQLDKMGVPPYSNHVKPHSRRLEWLQIDRQQVAARVEEQRVELSRMTEAVAKFLRADGHDLCHENRRELAEAFDLKELVPTKPATVGEFDAGCKKYQAELYGTCHADAEIQRLTKELEEVKKQQPYSLLPQGNWLEALTKAQSALNEELNARSIQFLLNAGWISLDNTRCWRASPTEKEKWPEWAKKEYALSDSSRLFTSSGWCVRDATDLQRRILADQQMTRRS